jgi:hypothetical protein
MRIQNGQPQQIGNAGVGAANPYRSKTIDKSQPETGGTSFSPDRARVSAEALEMSAKGAQFDEQKVDRLRASRSEGQLMAQPAVIAARIMQED